MRSRFPWRKRRARLLDPRPTFSAEALGRAFAINRSASAPRPKQKAAQLGLCRSRLSRGQHVSNAACGAEQHERDDEAPCDLKGAASTRWPSSARWRQGLERGHRPDWPNPRGAALVGVCPGHPKSYVADFTAGRAATTAPPLTSVRQFRALGFCVLRHGRHCAAEPRGGACFLRTILCAFAPCAATVRRFLIPRRAHPHLCGLASS